MGESMDFLKEWAFCLIIAGVAGTVATVIMPKGSTEKTLRAVIGIFVIAVICSPLKDIAESDFITDAFAAYGAVSYDDSYVEELNEKLADVCKETVEGEINKIAKEYGAKAVSVETEVSVDSDFCIIIHKINVIISKNDFSDTAFLAEKFSEKLLVPVDVNAE